MKKRFLICLFPILAILLTACAQPVHVPGQNRQTDETGNRHTEQPTTPTKKAVQENRLVCSINGKRLDVIWENNETVTELIACAQKETIVVHTTRYGGFEQVGSLPQNFSVNDVQITAQPGDIVLYAGNQLVLFFGSNTWRYTMLGHIKGLSANELSALLSEDAAVIEIKCT